MYLISDILYFFIFHIFGYRKRLSYENLSKSFPEKNKQEIAHIQRKYYRHLCDLLVEGVYNMYATPKSILKRYQVVNRKIMDRYYEEGKSVVLISSHFNNWEYMVTSLSFQFRQHGIGVGKPLDNKSIASYLTKRRIRYGTEVVDHTNVRDVMEYYHKYQVPVAYMMLSDQSPTNPHKSYWTNFLNQDTAFLYGAEHFARKYNMPVVYYQVEKTKRGHYQVHLRTLHESPESIPQYSITQQYVEILEQAIKQQPEYWLWSHRRWKLTREGRILKNGQLKIIKKQPQQTHQ